MAVNSARGGFRRNAFKNAAFLEGSIVKVYMKDFLTYHECEIKPGPHLNLIIGPNTTGKSSLVCAICLGLAGKTGFLGRAQQAVDFIRHGQSCAIIRIELFNPSGDNYIVQRKIYSNRSEWMHNGKSVPQKMIEQLVSKLNIQMDNLCQFLPQDKVADFAKMSPQVLLENTEKAAGPVSMFQHHQLLKDAREKTRQMQLQLSDLKERVTQEKQINSGLENDVKIQQTLKKSLEIIEHLKIKRAWVEFENSRKQYNKEKELKKKLGDEFRQAQAQHAPLQREIQALHGKVKAEADKMKVLTDDLKNQTKKAANTSRLIERESDRAKDLQEELQARRLQESRRRANLNEMRTHLETLKGDLEKVDESEDVQGQIERCTQNMRSIHHETTTITERGDVVRGEISALKREITNLQNQLKKLQDISNQRLNMLRTKHKDTYEAVVWLRSNQQRFSKPIHEPLMLIINVHEPRFTKYVEGHISYHDMRAFVCEDTADMEAFLKEVRDKQGLQVNAVMAPKETVDNFNPVIPLADLKPLGFNYYLKSLFECPDGVMAFLCKQYGVHSVPIGNDYTKENIELVAQHISRFYTTNHSYVIRRSRYSGQVSTRCIEIKKPQLLTVTVDAGHEEQLRKELHERQELLLIKEQEYRRLQSNHKELETRMEQLRMEKKKLNERKDLKRSLQQKILMKTQSIARLEGEAVDLRQEEEACSQQKKEISINKIQLVKQLKDFTYVCQQKSVEKVRSSIRHAVYIYQHQMKENEYREKSQDLQTLKNRFDEVSDRLKVTQNEGRRLLAEANKITKIDSSNDMDGIQAAYPTLKFLPNTLEEINSMIHDKTARVECSGSKDESVIQKYEQRKKDIAQMEVKLNKKLEELDNYQAQVAQIKTDWLQPLQKLIERINKGFSGFLAQMKCAGEVELSIPENPEDYADYGVRIKVKYRDSEQLRELSAHHHSGGERSVATVLYMMALQELTHCPFRCVDEINQGMDPHNERAVFELVVRTACRENTSQYFLLTPKLLPDLQYGDRMTILCVNNGPHMLSHKEWNVEKFIRRSMNLRTAAS